jgi:hypothetical protein
MVGVIDKFIELVINAIKGSPEGKGQNDVIGCQHREGRPEHAGIETGEQWRYLPPV